VLRSLRRRTGVRGKEDIDVVAAESIFSQDGIAFTLRWLHVLAGIAWIGLLYYFNLVQVPAFAQFEAEPHKEIGGKARNIAIDKVARKALWWFRWAAITTFVLGILIMIATDGYFNAGVAADGSELNWGRITGNVGISTGILLGTIMMLNVWGVIWRNQKIVLANAANVLAGGEPNPAAPAAGRKAVMASRQNMIFSIAMLYFMVYKSHFPGAGGEISGGNLGIYWTIALLIIVVLEVNALGLLPWKTQPNKGLNALYDGVGVRNPLVAAGGLAVIFIILTEVFFTA
jgi:uncharacterized membrane protein